MERRLSARKRRCFNPALGFLPVSTSSGRALWSGAVSFNPALGFLPVSTGDPGGDEVVSVGFQSRSGFSPRLDPTSGLRPMRDTVSIPLWVFSPSRLAPIVDVVQRPHVSIPLWVFSPSRPVYAARRPPSGRFQSRSGFSPRLDRSWPPRSATGSPCFNPALGFLPVSTPTSQTDHAPRGWFQSRSGFSPRLDALRREGYDDVEMFQSRSGFSPRLDVTSSPLPSRATACFNPALGFLPVSTLLSGQLAGEVDFPVGLVVVSIPLWVFSPSRQDEDDDDDDDRAAVSIPLWVFSPSRQGVNMRL